MAKKTFLFNHHKLSYELIEKNWKQKLKDFAVNFSLVFTLAIGINVFYFSKAFTWKYKNLSKENRSYINQCIQISEKVSQLKEELTSLQDKERNIYRPLVELEPVDKTILAAGFGGAENKNLQTNNPNLQLVSIINQSIDELVRQIYIQSRSYDQVIEKTLNRQEYLERIPGILPIPVNKLFRISDYFGWRKDPFTGERAQHLGVDLCAVQGTPVYASGKGIVTICEFSFSGYGNIVEISHGFGYKTRYAHLDKFVVTENQHVTRGQLIGYVGNTGRSTGDHLHYEVRIDNTPVDPLSYFTDNMTPEEYAQMVNDKPVALTY